MTTHLHMLPPSVNNLAVRVFLRAAGLPHSEENAWGKTRTPEFLDRVEKRLNEKGIKTKRVGKPTNAKVATPENLQKISSEVDVVLIGLSD